jgi:putative hydrolase of the HAD superfamily
MLHGVRWVLFDAVGTLIYADPPVAEVYFAAARQFGSSLAVAEIRNRFAAALSIEQGTDAAKLDRPPTSEAEERERWRRIVASVIDDTASSDILFEQLWAHFARPEHWRVYDDVAPALMSLSSRGIRLGIASNFDSRLHFVVAGNAALWSLEQAFVSSEIGYVKPDQRFFAAVKERLNAAAAEIMLVGDDEVNDSAGAAAAGWRNIFLDRKGGAAVAGAIRSLEELI